MPQNTLWLYKKEKRQLFRPCLTCACTQTLKYSNASTFNVTFNVVHCRERQKQVFHQIRNFICKSFTVYNRKTSAETCSPARRCSAGLYSHHLNFFLALGALSLVKWNARSIILRLEDWFGQSKHLIVWPIKLFSCCICLFSILVLRLALLLLKP